MEKAEFIELYSKADNRTKYLVEYLIDKASKNESIQAVDLIRALGKLDCITYSKLCKALDIPIETFLEIDNLERGK